MGRNKKYLTDDELLEAKRRWCREYYLRNKTKLDEKAKQRYHEKRSNLQNN